MKNNEKIIDLELDADGTFKPKLDKTRNKHIEKKNVKGRKVSIAKNRVEKVGFNPLEILISQGISQLERETRRLIRGLFR